MTSCHAIMFPVSKDEPKVVPHDHHAQAEFCTTRAAYRQGKELKAVKVYTINDESQHLLIQNVPSIGLLDEIKRLTSRFGKIDKVELLTDYPATTEFTHVYYVKYAMLRDARLAKKKLDNRSFYGGLLHVCYAPELETADECKKKILERVTGIQKKWKQPETQTKKRKGEVEDKSKSYHHSARARISETEVKNGTWSNLLPSSSSRVIPNKPSNSTEI